MSSSSTSSSVPGDGRFSPSVPWVLFLTLMVFFCVFPRLLVAPLLLRISEEFGVGFDTASRLFLTISAGFVAGLFVSGYFAKYLTHRWTVTLAVGAAGIMLIVVGVAASMRAVHLAMLALGFACGLYPGSGIASVASLVPDVHRGKALAIHESGPNFAFIMAPLICAAFAPFIGWRGVFIVSGIGAIASATAFGIFGRADTERGEPPHFANLRTLARNRSFWVVSFLLMTASIAAMGIYSVLPTFLAVDHGLDEALVNTVIGASRVIAFGAILTAGALSDRYGFRAVVLVIMILTGFATAMIGLSRGFVLILFVFFQPAIVGAFFPVGIAALTDIVEPRMRNVAVALAIPLANFVGGGLAPTLFSAVGAAGGFRAGFVVLGLFTAASAVTLRYIDTQRV
jgi:MFS family permease